MSLGLIPCPYCQHTRCLVVDSRPAGVAGETKRRRECQRCGKRFTTIGPEFTTERVIGRYSRPPQEHHKT